MYQNKTLKVKDVCELLGITPPTLYQNLKRLNVKTRQSPLMKGIRLSNKTIRKIYEMHVAGVTNYSIAKTLDISVATVRHHLNKGIPAELYTPPVKPMTAQATITMRTPSLWSRIKGWFN